MKKKHILDKDTAYKKLRRMAYEIIENNVDETEIIIVGIRVSGSVIANNIQKLLHEISQVKTDLISVTLDKRMPREVFLSKPLDFNNKVVLLIDDVANSGKTMLYALKPFLDFLPSKIQTLVLVERTHKAFPIKPDYVGLSVSTTLEEHIYVEVDGETVEGAWME